jgi:pyruvate formate lyase activating enzyme
LQPVLDMLTWLKEETNVWFEITNLVIPTLNDDSVEIRLLSDWILEHLGPDVPLHFTAFHPDFKLRDKPATPPATLHAARKIALEAGLNYVYEGNIHTGAADTICPGCGKIVIRRSWHNVLENTLQHGACPFCHFKIPGRWNVHAPTRPLPTQAYRDAAKKYEDLNF